MIPVYEPYLSDTAKSYAVRAIEDGWISSKGEYVGLFRQAIEALSQASVLPVCNGTIALEVALRASGWRGGGEVIVPAFTYIASVNAIINSGYKPVLVDVDIDNWLVDEAAIASALTQETVGVLPVSLYDNAIQVNRFYNDLSAKNIGVIVDGAEAFGTKVNGEFHGSEELFLATTYSFFGNKTVTTGEGGAISSREAAFMARLEKICNQGLIAPGAYDHDTIATNARMTNIQAALGLAQLEELDVILALKTKVYDTYRRNLSGLPIVWQDVPLNVSSARWLVTFLVENSSIRSRLRRLLADRGVDSRPTFRSVNTMDCWREYTRGSCPNSESLADRGLSVPSSPLLTAEQIEFVCSLIRTFFEGESRSGAS